jgi:hypothetical protein
MSSRSTSRTAGLTGLGVALVLAFALPAAAAERKFLGTSPEQVRTDGTRFAVFKSSDTKLTVIDDARKRRFRMSVEPNCLPSDAAPGGFVLLGCSGGDAAHYIIDLRKRTSIRLQEMKPDPFRWYNADYEGFSDIGRTWLKGSSAQGPVIPLYLNWHTGERRGAPEADPPYTPLDLDSSDLRPLGPPQSQGFAFAVDPPFSIAQTDQDTSPDVATPGELVLYRDGTAKKLGTRVVRLSRCRLGCGSVTLGAGVVTWSEGRVGHTYVIRTRQRLSRTFTQHVGNGLEHTRSTLYWTRYGKVGEPRSLFAFPLR